MSVETAPRVAMVGMYGGMWREFNPGCFMIAHKTKRELEARIDGVGVDVYSIDNKSQGSHLDEVTVGGTAIKFFSRETQADLLDGVLCDYDAVVMGGDIIWGGDDVVPDNDIFFLDSETFWRSPQPPVMFNSVHTFYDDERIAEQLPRFARAIERSSYTAVRTPAFRDRLARLGLQGAVYVPDPVLDLDMGDFAKPKPFLPTERDKPILGISVRNKLSDVCADALKEIDIDEFDVVVLPFSRQYDNLGTLEHLRSVFGSRFSYVPDYLDPVQSYQLVGELDMFLNDTYHGVIASIIHGKPFVSLDVEPETTSRKQQLLAGIDIDGDYNLRLGEDATHNLDVLTEQLPRALAEPVAYNMSALDEARSHIQAHFDTMAAHIINA